MSPSGDWCEHPRYAPRRSRGSTSELIVEGVREAEEPTITPEEVANFEKEMAASV